MRRAHFVSFYLIIIFWVLRWVSCDKSCQINSRQLPRYKLIKSKSRSNQQIISRRKVADVNKCREFATSKKALAFNYGFDAESDDMRVGGRTGGGKSVEKMCQALQCPEVYNFATLVRDKNYAYYSMYPSNVSHGQGTLACVPRAGVFLFARNNLNYSQAEISCQKMNASLAHVISEERTNGVAKFITEGKPVFVGLSNRDSDGIWKNQFDEPLSCFSYLAWGEGEPSHSKGCVGLVQPSESNSDPFWRVVPCYAALPFVCELFPTYRSFRDRN